MWLPGECRDYWVRREALRALAEGWREQPETSELLRERAVKDQDEYVRETALEALAAGWPDEAAATVVESVDRRKGGIAQR
jgi:HEAT repeat protein